MRTEQASDFQRNHVNAVAGTPVLAATILPGAGVKPDILPIFATILRTTIIATATLTGQFIVVLTLRTT